MIYLVAFSLSVLFAFFANKYSGKLFFLFSFFSILVMVLFSGLRSYTVGIDVHNYYTQTWYWPNAISADSVIGYLKGYISYGAQGFREYIFALFLGAVAQFTGNFRVFLFLAHLIIITCVYIGAFRQKKHVNPVFVLLLFYLLFYNHSLNIIRQYMALSIVFAFLADIEQKRFVRYTIVTIFASLIHTSSILSLGVLFIYFVLYGKSKRINPQPGIRKLFLVLCLVFLVLGFEPFCRILIEFNILGDKYRYYFSGSSIQHGTIVTVFLLLEILAVFFFRNQLQKNKYFDFFLMNSITYLFLQQLSGFMLYGKRIATFFCINNIITIVFLCMYP